MTGEGKIRPMFGGRAELCFVLLLAWLAFLSVPLVVAPMGLSWDALNHHIYLGWIADRSRLDQDFLAAGYQTLSYPYLYWPVYKLAAAGAGPLATGLVMASIQALGVPAVWLIARACIPGGTMVDATMRTLAVVLAYLSGVTLAQHDSTSNDMMAAIPFVWAMALALEASRPERQNTRRLLLVGSGLLAGVSVGFKLSNGPLAVLLPLLWIFAGTGAQVTARQRLIDTTLAGFATLLGAIAAYGYWGVELWNRYGNPLYPFYDSLFAPLRAMTGWVP